MAPGLTAILSLDHKLGRVVAKGKGVTLSSAEADLLAELGVMKLLGDAKDEALREAVEGRKDRVLLSSGNSTPPAPAPASSSMSVPPEYLDLLEQAERRRCIAAVQGIKGRRR